LSIYHFHFVYALTFIHTVVTMVRMHAPASHFSAVQLPLFLVRSFRGPHCG
jgi:hypothetical protein